MILSEADHETPRHVAFNQDSSCFVAAYSNGFAVYRSDPLSLLRVRAQTPESKQWRLGGASIVEMLCRTNVLALVPEEARHKVLVWDDADGRCLAELTFRSPVRAMRLTRTRVIVVLEYKVYIYSLQDLRLLDHLETTSNVKGLCAVSAQHHTFVCPSLQKGVVRVEHWPETSTTQPPRTKLICAHEGALAALAVNESGSVLATASETGTVIRVFDTATMQLLIELRRGSQPADIHSLKFSADRRRLGSSSMSSDLWASVLPAWLACSSDTGTVHVFSLQRPAAAALKLTEPAPEQEHKIVKNPQSIFMWASEWLPEPASGVTKRWLLPKYLTSEWSFARFRVADLPKGSRVTVAFAPSSGSTSTSAVEETPSLLVVTSDGHYSKLRFSESSVPGAECTQQVSARFPELMEEDTRSREPSSSRSE